MKLLHFLFSAYLFAKRKNRAEMISSILEIPQKCVFDFAMNPLWKPVCRLFGYKGEFRMKGLERYRSRPKNGKDLHHTRMRRTKDDLKRQYAEMRNDLTLAERKWTRQINDGELPGGVV